MSKHITEQTNWRDRSASYSTHGSRRGTNLLGWDKYSPEWLSATQERSALVDACKRIQELLADKTIPKYRREQLGQEQFRIQNRINEIRPKLRNRFVGVEKYLLDVLKENTPKAEWIRHYEEAIRRMRAEHQNDAEAA